MAAGSLVGMFAAAVLAAHSSFLANDFSDSVENFASSALEYVQHEALNPFVPGGMYEDMQIIYVAGSKRVYLQAEDVVDWVRYWEDGHWDIDDDKIAEYVKKLQKEFDTWNYYKVLETTEGKTVCVPPGEYGWRVDRGEETRLISKMLRNNGTTAHRVVFSSEAANHGLPSKDYGDSYVEIDLTNQRLWVYKEGEMVISSDIVSGMMNTDRQTPPGAYAIYYRQSPAVLKGADYEQPVSYWMPFNGGIGLHDATWQYSFGGDACYYRGSHGCINLPYEKAAEIFDTVKKGYPILCYY